jgi:hypothetical protein
MLVNNDKGLHHTYLYLDGKKTFHCIVNKDKWKKKTWMFIDSWRLKIGKPIYG